jgi:hypothetical protein
MVTVPQTALAWQAGPKPPRKARHRILLGSLQLGSTVLDPFAMTSHIMGEIL